MRWGSLCRCVVALALVLGLAGCDSRGRAAGSAPGTAGPVVAGSTITDEARLAAREASLLAALSARDLERTLLHFASASVANLQGMSSVHGSESIRTLFERVFASLVRSEYTPEAMQLAPTGRRAESTGRVENVFSGPDGEVAHTGTYSVVWDRRGEEWWVTIYSIRNDTSGP